jgi:hypothetical protein
MPLHSVNENGTSNFQIFPVQSFAPASFIQIKNEGEGASLNEFEIFGQIKMTENSVNLRSLTKRANPVLKPHSIYSFSLQQDWGLIAFLLSGPPKKVFRSFLFYARETPFNSSVLNLIKKDQTIWSSTDQENSFILISLCEGWTFHPTGFKLKSSFRNYPRTWKFIGHDSNCEKTIFAEFTEEERLSSPFAEFAFPVQSNLYFQDIRFIQTGANSEGNKIFSLSQIEIFGELKHF